MAKYLLPYFGDLTTDNLEPYYDVYIDIAGEEIKIDLNFVDDFIDVKRLEIVKEFIDNIAEYSNKNRNYIESNYTSEHGAVRLYVEHHLSELDKTELSGIVDFNTDRTNQEKQLINSLSLVRVGFYPYDDNQFAIFDYSIGRDITQYLIVVSIDKGGNFDGIVMES